MEVEVQAILARSRARLLPPTAPSAHPAPAALPSSSTSRVAANILALPPPPSADAFAAAMMASAKRASVYASALPIALAAPLPAKPSEPLAPAPELVAEYRHLAARSASLFRLGHREAAVEAKGRALALAACIPSSAQPPHPPPPDAPRAYPPHQTYLNSLPDRAAPYRRQQLAASTADRPPPSPPPLPSPPCPPAALPPTPSHLPPPGARRFRRARKQAAALAPSLTIQQVAKIFEVPAEVLLEQPPNLTLSELIALLATWSPGYLASARTNRLRLYRFVRRRRSGFALGQQVHGHDVLAFLNGVESKARADAQARARRREARGLPAGRSADAMGCTARTGASRALRFLAHKLFEPICVDAVAVKRGDKARGRRRGKPAASLSMRMTCNLEDAARHAPTEFERGFSGGAAAMVHFALRYVNAQRSRVVGASGGVVRGVCDLDAKIAESEQNPRPMWAAERGFLGRADHWAALARSLEGVESLGVLVRDTDSVNGDPALATRWLRADEEYEMSGARFCCALKASLTRGRYPVSSAAAASATKHSSKHVLPNVSRGRCEPPPVTNEVGKWSGSIAQAADASAVAMPHSAATAASHQEPMGDVYSSEAADEIVPAIMERQVAAVRSLIARLGGPEHLPEVGGWGLLEPASADAVRSAQAVIAAARAAAA